MNKGKECIYLPSKRGGPRVSKRSTLRSQLPEQPDVQDGGGELSSQTQASLNESIHSASIWPSTVEFSGSVLSMINPGAGLAPPSDSQELFQDSDVIFDSIFTLPSPPSTVPTTESISVESPTLPDTPIVRTYRCDQDL